MSEPQRSKTMANKAKRQATAARARAHEPRALAGQRPALEAEYAKYFVPQGPTPDAFQIFTLTDWRKSVGTADHT